MAIAKEILDTVIGKLEGMAKTQNVVGEPMEIKGRTIIPLVEFSIGVGGGAGEGNEPGGKGEGNGGGGGGGVKITPLAVVCVDDAGLAVYAIGAKGQFLGKLAELVPQIMDRAMEMKKEKKE